METIKLGSLVRDKITGFKGIATGRTIWLHGCDRICVEPQSLHDGKPIEAQWFDSKRLDLVKSGVVETEDAPDEEKPGGPQNDPPSRTSRP